MLMVYLDHIHMARIENYLISLCKARILAASACTCKNKGRAREGKDACFRTSSLLAVKLIIPLEVVLSGQFENFMQKSGRPIIPPINY